MKTRNYSSRSKKSVQTAKRRISKVALSTSIALGYGVAASTIQAATVTWSGTNSTDWAASGNWSGGTPSATNVAEFMQSFDNAPSLTGSGTVQGLWLAPGVGADVTIDAASAQTLTLAGNGTINAQANAGIYMNDAGNHNFTTGSNVSISLSSNTGFYNQQSGGVLTVSGTLSLNGKTLTIGSGTSSLGAVTLAGPISSSAGALSINTASVVTLSSSNAYTGATTITGGTLAISGAGTLGAGSSALAVGAGTLDLNASSQTVAAVTMTGAGAIRNGTLTGTSYVVNTASGTAVISANLAGASSSFTKAGSGIVLLSGSNTWGGPTTVSAGTLDFANPNAIPAASPSISASSATIAVSFGGATEFTDSQVTALLGSGTLTFNSGAAFGIDTVSQSGTFAANLSMPTGLTKLGANTLTLTGSNTYTGVTTVTGGTLAVGSANAIPTTTNLAINGGVFDLNGNNLTVNATQVGGTAGTLTDNSIGSGTSTLTLTNCPGIGGMMANRITDGANGQKVALVLTTTVENLASANLTNSQNTYSGGTILTGTVSRGLRLYIVSASPALNLPEKSAPTRQTSSFPPTRRREWPPPSPARSPGLTVSR